MKQRRYANMIPSVLFFCAHFDHSDNEDHQDDGIGAFGRKDREVFTWFL